jgi:uncharacterized protein with ATP-grasp and redox domains
MKSDLECLYCLLKQGLNTARMATQDRTLQREILNRISRLVPEADLSLTPAELSRKVYEIVSQVTGVSDPFRQAKEQSNREALSLLPRLEKLVAASEDRLSTALHLAVAGNIIDIGIGHAYDLSKDVIAILNTPFAVDDSADFKKEARAGRRLLYVGDNAGEIVFDRVLVQELVRAALQVIFAVKGGPVINDATMEDAEKAGIAKLVPTITTGAADIGVNLGHVSAEFLSALESADVVLAKGHGNFETLSGQPYNIYFLLKAKCEVVSRELGVKIGDIVFKKKINSLPFGK